jgi:predicted RNase H-like HicB family nuclease
MDYAIVIEASTTGYAAYVPDLPGCAVMGDSEEEVRTLIRDAIAFHLEGLAEEGLPVPAPSSRVEYVHVPDAA